MDLLSDLNESQRQAVTHIDGPLLVLAGAGSGKTRVITRRVAHLIRQGVAPWQVLAITFTNKAAREMAERIAALDAPPGATACTFHSLCARLLREFAGECDLSPRYSIYDDADQKRLVKRVMTAAGLDAATINPAAALSAISHAKMRLQRADAYADQAATFGQRQLAKVYAAYERALHAANALDFDDLLMRMAFLLRDRPDVRQLLSQRYRYVLIDEYQDTNHAQYIIAHGIALDHENICATGDPDQSIYSWRGADVANILEFERDYTNATVIRLETNYRSTASILAAADRLIACNRRRKEKKLIPSRSLGEAVTVVATLDEHAEAAEIVQRIRAAVEKGRRHDDIALFYRLNSLSRVMEDALRKSATPYRIARGVAFYGRKEIKDVLAYLKLLHNPLDDVACERIINVPARGIGATTLRRLRAWGASSQLSLLEAVGRIDEVPSVGAAARKRVAAFGELIGRVGECIDAPVRQILEAVLDATGMERALRTAGGEDQMELANVQELVTSADEFDRENPDAGLSEYLNQVALVSDIDRFEGSTGAVTLMTLHAAKGLEFPVVMMIGCEDAILPFQRMDRTGSDRE